MKETKKSLGTQPSWLSSLGGQDARLPTGSPQEKSVQLADWKPVPPLYEQD